MSPLARWITARPAWMTSVPCVMCTLPVSTHWPVSLDRAVAAIGLDVHRLAAVATCARRRGRNTQQRQREPAQQIRATGQTTGHSGPLTFGRESDALGVEPRIHALTAQYRARLDDRDRPRRGGRGSLAGRRSVGRCRSSTWRSAPGWRSSHRPRRSAAASSPSALTQPVFERTSQPASRVGTWPSAGATGMKKTGVCDRHRLVARVARRASARAA